MWRTCVLIRWLTSRNALPREKNWVTTQITAAQRTLRPRPKVSVLVRKWRFFFQFGLPFTRIQWKRSPKTLLFKKTGHFRKLRCPVQTTRVDYVTGSDTSNAHASKMVPFLVTIVFSCRRAKTIQVECLIQNINLFLKYSDSACGWKVYDKSHAKTSGKGQRRNGETADWTECVS